MSEPSQAGSSRLISASRRDFLKGSTAALVGGFVVSCVLAFMMGDYARKPAFRVRRTASDSTDAGPTVNRPAGQAPDWTYTTRSK